MSTATLPSTDWLRACVYFYGAALGIVGFATLVLGGLGHWTAAIPLILGIMFVMAGTAARLGAISDGVAGWAAVGIGIVALVGTLSAVPQLPAALAAAPEIANPAAVLSRAATALVSLGALAVLVPLLVACWRSRGRNSPSMPTTSAHAPAEKPASQIRS